jgi:hypothetical protein
VIWKFLEDNCCPEIVCKIEVRTGLVAIPVNPSYLGSSDQEDHGAKPAREKWLARTHHQNKQSKVDWRSGLSGTVPAL